MAPDTISQAIYRIRRQHEHLTAPCELCGLQRIERTWMHGFRHEAASLMVQAGIDLATAAEVLGHSTPMVTAAIYSHGETETRRQAVAAIPTFELPSGI